MGSLLGGNCLGERLRVGQPDVLRGEANQPPRDVERVFASLQHPAQPVERGVGVAVAQTLV